MKLFNRPKKAVEVSKSDVVSGQVVELSQTPSDTPQYHKIETPQSSQPLAKPEAKPSGKSGGNFIDWFLHGNVSSNNNKASKNAINDIVTAPPAGTPTEKRG